MRPLLTKARARTIAALAVPITAGMGSQNLLNLVDVAMLGRLGKEEVAAVGLCGMVLWVLTSLIQGFSHSVQTITARRLGEQKSERLHEAAMNAFYFILLTGLPFTVIMVSLTDTLFQYLTSDPAVAGVGTDYLSIRLYTLVIIGFNLCFRGYFNGLKKSALYTKILIGMHLVNILANYTLIFGKWGAPELGARGAAWGTAVATTLGCIVLLAIMLRMRNESFSFSPKALSWPVLKTVMRIAVPSSLQSFAMSAGFLVFFRIAESISTSALAATNVLINLTLVCVLVAMGQGIATITLVSKALGEKEPDEAVAWVRGTATITTICLTIIGALYVLFPEFWLSLFLPDPEVIALAKIPLILVGISQLYDGLGIVLSYAHLGGGSSRTVMVISVLNQWVLFIPACFIWTYFFDGELFHLWLCMVLYRLCQCLSYIFSIRRGRWLTVKV